MTDEPTSGKKPEAAYEGPRVDPRLLELLVCPLTKTRLEYDPQRQELVSRAAGLAFPIRNGVPLMTLDAARPIDPDARRPENRASHG
jgi:uncharacterized protein